MRKGWMAGALVAGGAVIAGGLIWQSVVTLGAQPGGTFVVPTNQTLSPIGTVVRFEYARPKDLVVSPDGSAVAVLAHRRLVVLRPDGAVGGELDMRGSALGVAWSPDGRTICASAVDGKVVVASWDGRALAKGRDVAVEAAGRGNPHLTGMVFSRDGRTLYVGMSIRNAVAEIDLGTQQVRRTIPTGVAPFHLSLSPDGRTLAVANRGGARVGASDAQMDPNTGKPFQGTGVPTALSAGTPVQIDPQTDATWRGSVSLIDTEGGRTREVTVGRHPAGMAFSGDGRTLYVAETDSDSVSFLDVAGGRVTGNLSVRPKEDPLFGQMPTDIAPSADGRRLFVSLGGVNAVAVVALGARPRVEGYLPTGWYPVALGLGGDRMFVASAKGIGARPADKQTAFGVHDSVGMVQAIPLGELRALKRHSQTVASNNRWDESPRARRGRAPVPVPARLGEPSRFRHVVYIIKENLTYDSTLGDMREGNGDPSLCTFGEEVTPNHHALAREFVLLDNFYTSGTNSADGHQWVSSSVANGYTEQNYSANARSYPYDGGDPLAFSPEGFLWTAAHKAGKRVRVFGEFVDQPKVIDPATRKAPTWTAAWQDYRSGANRMIIEAHTSQAALRPHLHPRFIGFPSIITDQWRADQFLAEFKDWERAGRMPELSILLLPNDHTVGTHPAFPTPRATVADNDLALGRIVEAISKSRFWRETLILVVEDDSQLGVDHVDGHRSVAFCISPYTRRGAVVREPYNHTSFARTIGLVLGIPPMNRFDRTGTPLTACFTSRLDPRPYTARPNRVPLDEMNPPARALTGEARELALACERLDWSDVDRAHASTVARAAWRSVKGDVPFPQRFYRPPADQD